MIKNLEPLTLAEVSDLIGKEEKSEKLKIFIKHFNKMPVKKAVEMKESIKKLGLIKLKDEHIVKIIDFMPEDAEDLSKILQGVSLDQNEADKILEIIKKY